MAVATGLTRNVTGYLTVKMGLMKLIVSKWHKSLPKKPGVNLTPRGKKKKKNISSSSS
jgi:hypothetical protein